MSKTPHQSYTAKFRESAVRQALKSNRAVTAIAKELGVNARLTEERDILKKRLRTVRDITSEVRMDKGASDRV